MAAMNGGEHKRPISKSALNNTEEGEYIHNIRAAKFVMEGKVEGRPGMSRRQMWWQLNIRHWTDICTAEELCRLAEDKDMSSHGGCQGQIILTWPTKKKKCLLN